MRIHSILADNHRRVLVSIEIPNKGSDKHNNIGLPGPAQDTGIPNIALVGVVSSNMAHGKK